MARLPEFSRAFEGKVRRKRNVTGNIHYQPAREKARRICGYSPEVMVRITSYGKGDGNARANMGYISRIDVKDKEDLALETDRGEILDSRQAIKEYAEGWQQDFGKPNKRRRDTMRLMLSMPAGTNPEAVKNATREFARTTFGGNHEYVFVLHTDEPHPHCHLLIKMLGHDGKRLDPGRDDLADWRERFAHEMRAQGVDAVATRRAARGVVRKAEQSVVRHIENDGRVPKVVALRERDAADLLAAEQQGRPMAPGAWEAPIRAEQAAVRSAWLAAADALERGQVRPVFLPADYQERIRRSQHGAAAYQARAASAPPHPQGMAVTRHVFTGSQASLRTSVPTLASLGAAHASAARPVFLPADHQERVQQAQRSGASYQVKQAAPRAGEPPRPARALDALPGIAAAPWASAPVVFRQRRPFPVKTLAALTAPAGVRSTHPQPVFHQENPHEQPDYTQHRTAVYQSHLATPRSRPPESVARLRELPGVDVVRHGPAQVLLQPNARDRMGWRAGAGDGLRWAGTGPAGDRAGTGRGSGTQGRGGAAAGRPETGVEAGREGNPTGTGAGSAAGRQVGTLAGAVRLAEVAATAAADQALAAEIRAFVAAMPPVETTRDVLKRQLAARFAVPAQVLPQAVPSAKPQPAASPPASGQEKGADPAAPT